MSDERPPRGSGSTREAGEGTAVTSVAREGTTSVTYAMSAPVVGFIAGAAPGGALLVDFEGNAAGPLPARSTVPLDASAVLAALAARREVVLIFERGDPGRPIVIGLVEPPAPLLELMLGEPFSEETDPLSDASEAVDAGAAPRAAAAIATVDGQRVLLEGRDEVVLRCGEASITLRRNGKVIIRGAYVETHAAGVNRIKGGAVRIN